VAEGTHPPGALQFRIRRSDGGIRVLEASGENLLDNPAVGGLLISLRDVSDRVALEERLRESQRLEAVGQLAGGVAHDFNNILTALAGHTELLLEDLPPEDPVRLDVEEIRKGIQRATGLTSRLLAFSRRQILMLQVLDLGEVLRGVEELLRRVLRSNIELVLESRDPGPVRADPNQMEQVILNLAINARDAMPAGGTLRMVVESAEITAEAARWYPYAVVPGDYVRLTVSDTGEGMDEATRARIFEPFFTTKPVGVGTGLGLAMVYGVVKQSRGYVWAESRPGEGATFRIYLPRVFAEEGRTHAPEAGTGA
jgi:two-component system, cell cycle sensor histidine kinase and response regulator CckA